MGSQHYDFTIETLGEATRPSPVPIAGGFHDDYDGYVSDERRLLYKIVAPSCGPSSDDPKSSLEIAGPRSQIFFDPAQTHVAIVTCGGLCPGLNDVLRALVMCLWYRYGVRSISGIRYGYRGLLPEFGRHAADERWTH